jgi:hypothetical protein
MQNINVKEQTFEISSSGTLQDHEARHKSRHMINMTPNVPRTEVSTRKTPGLRDLPTRSSQPKIYSRSLEQDDLSVQIR